MIRAEDEDMFGDLEEFRARPGGGEGAGGMKYVSHQVSTISTVHLKHLVRREKGVEA